MRFIAIISAFFVLGHAAMAQPSKQDFVAIFEKMAQNDAQINQILDQINVNGQVRDLLRQHFIDLFQNDAIIEAMSEELSQNYSLFAGKSDDEASVFARNFGAAWAQAKGGEGIKRLPPEEQKAFFSFALGSLRSMPAEACAGSIRGMLSAFDMGMTEIQTYSHFEATDLANYLSLSRRSLIAEITGTPAFIPLTTTENEIAATALGSAFLEALKNHPRRDEMFLAADLSEQASDSDVCEVTLLIIELALDIKGQTGDWVIRYLTSP